MVCLFVICFLFNVPLLAGVERVYDDYMQMVERRRHKDITERLSKINFPLYETVFHVLEKNKSERHIRGGEATKRKYKGNSNKISF